MFHSFTPISKYFKFLFAQLLVVKENRRVVKRTTLLLLSRFLAQTTKGGLFYLHFEVVHDETVNVCLLFKNFCHRFATAMASLCVDADENWIVAHMALLQGGCKLKRMCGHHTVVMVCCGDKRGGITNAWFQVVKR